jgi:hypothetical protein
MIIVVSAYTNPTVNKIPFFMKKVRYRVQLHHFCAICTVLLLAFVMLPASVIAQAQTSPTDGMKENTPAVHAFTNATIVTAPGRVLNNATLVIRDGVAEEVTDLDEEREPEGEEQWRGEPLTIGELLATADRAEEQGAEQVEVEREPGTGRPVAITIDYIEAAIDDEICYTMSDFTEE